jgi:DUF4097 and DUF4098 domain-containing protein YvlB
MMLTLVVGAAALLAPMQLPQDTTVTVPQGTRLELDAHSGSISVRTWNRSAIQVSADLGSDRYRIGVEVEGGVARIRREARRGVSHPDLLTDYRLTVPVWMDLELSSVEGDITVDNSQGRLNLSTVEGGVRVRGGRDFVSIHSVEGDVVIDGTRGRLEANSVDGEILISNTEGEIFAETVDGDITMESITSSDVEANTVDGNISYRGRVVGQGRYRLGSHDGDITLEVPELNGVVSVSTFEGEFSSCGYPATVTGSGERSNKRRFRFTVGSGGAQVDLESFDGNIYLVKTGCR